MSKFFGIEVIDNYSNKLMLIKNIIKQLHVIKCDQYIFVIILMKTNHTCMYIYLPSN